MQIKDGNCSSTKRNMLCGQILIWIDVMACAQVWQMLDFTSEHITVQLCTIIQVTNHVVQAIMSRSRCTNVPLNMSNHVEQVNK